MGSDSCVVVFLLQSGVLFRVLQGRIRFSLRAMRIPIIILSETEVY